MLRKVSLILVLLILFLPGLFGCRKKEEFVPWGTSHWEKIKDEYVTAFAIDPEDSNIIYAAMINNMTEITTLSKSKDGGKHWNTLPSLSKLVTNVYPTIDAIYIDPKSHKNIWISEHGAGVLFSSDGGVTWKKDSRKSESDILKMYNDSSNNKSLPVTYNYRIADYNSPVGAIYLSLDSGKTWKRTPLPPLIGVVSNPLAVNRENPNVLYVFGASGLFKSVEGKGDYEYYPVGDSLNTSYIYVDPQNPNSLYAVSYSYNSFATFYSSDYGKTWEKKGDFYFNPLYPDIFIKIVTTKATPPSWKLYVSLDNGKSWKLSDLDLNKNGIYSISVGGKGVIYADTYNGLFRSEDKGLHWSQITNFREDYWQVTDGNSCFNSKVLVSPDDPNTIYWATELLESTDGGKTWQKMNIIQHSKRIHGSAIAIDPHNHNLVYLGITGTEDIEPLSPEEFAKQGIYRSNDGGKNWEKIGLGGYRVSSIVISPTTGIIYAGTYYNGLFKSVDSGNTWERITLDNDLHLSVSSLAIDPKNSIVYIGVLGGGIFKIENKK